MEKVHYEVQEKFEGMEKWYPFVQNDRSAIRHPTEISALGEKMYADKEWPESEFRIVKITTEPIGE